MYNIQVSGDNQQILEEQLRQNKESGSDLWYKNAMNNQSGQLYNGNINHNFNQNYKDTNQIMNNQYSSSENRSAVNNLSNSNNFRNSVQQIKQVIEDGAINCNRCSKTPIDYISLNCGHDFCLECMAISVIKGEGKVIQSLYQDSQNGFGNEENQNGSLVDTIVMSCFTCGKGSELGYQSTRAIDIFIQMVIQKYEQKQNILSNQQTQNEDVLIQPQIQQINGIYTQNSSKTGNLDQQMKIGTNTQQEQRQSDILQVNKQIEQNNEASLYQQQMQFQQQQLQLIQLQQKQQAHLQQQQQKQIIPDNLQQYYDQNFIQYQNEHLGSARTQEENDENEEVYYNQKNLNNNININNGINNIKNLSQNNINHSNNINKSNINNINGINNQINNKSNKLMKNNIGMNEKDSKQSNDDLLKYESNENIHTDVNQKGISMIQKNEISGFQSKNNQLQVQQNQQHGSQNNQYVKQQTQLQNLQMNEFSSQQQQIFQQKNGMIQQSGHVENFISNNNNIVVNNGIRDPQLTQIYQSNYENSPTTPYMKTPQQTQQYEQHLHITNIRQSDKVRISQNEEDISIQQVHSEYTSATPQNAVQNQIHEKQMFHQQQQLQQDDLKNSTYQNGSQNNLISSTPNYSMLTEKKPTQPQYSQMIPTNNLTPQNTQNISKKSPHLSKSTHLMHNDGNHTPYQAIAGKTTGYSPNTAQSQQFAQNSPEYQQIQNYHHHPQQFMANQPPLFSTITTNKEMMLQVDESNEQNNQNDVRNKLSAFSASKNKNPIQQKGQIIHLSHLQPYGNEDITSILQAQLSHNQKHGIPYRQQSQLETGIIEQIETNQVVCDNNIEYEDGSTNMNEINRQQQKQFGSQQHQGRVQLQQVEEIKESNSAVNSIVGSSTAQINCNDHRFNELSLYCFTCDNKLLCIKCLQNGEHRDHDVQSIHKNFHYLLAKMSETSHEINVSIEKFAIHEKKLQEQKKEYQKQIKIIKEQIQENLNEVKASLVNKEQDLLQQAEQMYTMKTNEINKKIQEIQNQTQIIYQVKNSFESICESNTKKTNSTLTEREDDNQQQQQYKTNYHNYHSYQESNLQNRQQQQQSYNQQPQNNEQKQKIFSKPSASQNDGNEQQKNIRTQENYQSQNYEMVEHDFNEEFYDSSKSEMEKLNLFRFYAECKSVLCSIGISRNPQINDRLNSTLNQSITPQQYSSNHLSPHQTRNHISETPRNNNQQQQQYPYSTQNTQYYPQPGSNQGSNYLSNQQYLQAQQKQFQTKQQIGLGNYPGYSNNYESQYASIRSNNSQPQDDEEQLNNEQQNLMSSQDLSQLIDDVQRIKKEANQIDLQNYNQKQNNQNLNHYNNQKDYQNNNYVSNDIPQSYQPPQRRNQLFHEYLNQQRFQYNNQQQQMSQNYNQKEQQDEQQLAQRKQFNNNSEQQQNIQMQDDQAQKNFKKNNEKPSVYSQYLLQRLSQNTTHDNNKISSSYHNQNTSHTNHTQLSDSDPLKKNISKNADSLNNYINSKKSKWLDEETLEQDQEYFHNYHSYAYKNSSLYEKLNSTGIDKRDQSNYKQKQELNKHLDNIFRNIGGSPNSFNKIQSLNQLEYSHNQNIGNFSNSVIAGMNGYQTERININPNIQNFINTTTTQINKTPKGQKNNLNLKATDYPSSTSSIPFSPNFKSQAIKSQNSFTTRVQNSGISRQSASQHLKINPSMSIHNTTSNIQYSSNNNHQQQSQSFMKFNNNYQKSVKAQTNYLTQNQINSNREITNNLNNLFETLRIQKEQFNLKKKNHFLIDK